MGWLSAGRSISQSREAAFRAMGRRPATRPRAQRTQAHAVEVIDEGGDWYELVDRDGDSEVLYLPNPVPREMVVHIYRRFGELHGFEITALVKKRH